MPSSDVSSSQTLIENSYTASLPMTLELRCPVPWTESQLGTLTHNYPFVVEGEETTEDYVIRRYLEVLWMPESIMPLDHLVRTLHRITPVNSGATNPPSMPSTKSADASNGPQAHPLHGLLDPLILTARTVTNKYHVDLARVIAERRLRGEEEEQGDEDGGGVEESMMWYAWNHEHMPEESESTGEDGGETAEARWQKSWLNRMERREVLIQILLLLAKLSLSGPCPELPAPPPPPPAPSFPDTPQRRGRKRNRDGKARDREDGKRPPPPSPEDRLEAFMDRLSMWQLSDSLERDLPSSSMARNTSSSSLVFAPTKTSNGTATRDWAQVFCEDVVEPLFKDSLPDFCSLLRSKVFPTTLFSDPESDFDFDFDKAEDSENPTILTDSPLSSQSLPPDEEGIKSQRRSVSRDSASTRVPSRQLTLTRAPSIVREDSLKVEDQRRSRSLSVSLAEDSARQKESLISKPALTREVSMSRTFKGMASTAAAKAKARAKPKPAPKAAHKNTNGGSVTGKNLQATQGVTLVEATPEKPRYPGSSSQGTIKEEVVSDSEGEEALLGGAGDDMEHGWTTPSKRRRRLFVDAIA